ncbi:MAG TPA: DUF4194 domain-containing protein [Treponemataceae bacterium]|nr:DUF4194 domain-containing protein [Treponemataceae bacterium]
MKPEPSEMALIGELTDAEFDAFRSCARILLSKTFLIRSFEREEKLYEFALRNVRLLELWFSCAGIELRRDEGLGVIACRAGHEMRARLGREETAALLVARLIFEEERGGLRLSRFPSVSVGDFLRRFLTVTGIEPRKTRMAEAFRRLEHFRLIELSSDPADPDGTILLYPSLALALDMQAIEEIEKALEAEKRAASAVEPDNEGADDEGEDDEDEEGDL